MEIVVHFLRPGHFESGLVRMGGQAADVVAIVLPNMPDKNLIMQIVAVLSAGG